MKQNFLLMWFGIGAMFLAASHANAQSANCGPHPIIVERLADSYGEIRQSIGLRSNNSVMEIFASLESSTWTVTVTRPGGPSCLVASGEGVPAFGKDIVRH